MPHSGTTQALIRPWGVGFLALLLLLASTQFALQDPRSQTLPAHLLSGDLCRLAAPKASPHPDPSHTQAHCPLCLSTAFAEDLPEVGGELKPLPLALLLVGARSTFIPPHIFLAHPSSRGPPLA